MTDAEIVEGVLAGELVSCYRCRAVRRQDDIYFLGQLLEGGDIYLCYGDCKGAWQTTWLGVWRTTWLGGKAINIRESLAILREEYDRSRSR